MQEAGVTNVYQLDGGILKYFEQNGHVHFDGECFVFDERRAVDAALNPRARMRQRKSGAVTDGALSDS
jgi:UPF0176 protein